MRTNTHLRSLPHLPVVVISMLLAPAAAAMQTACSGDTTSTVASSGPEAGTNLVLGSDDAAASEDAIASQAWPQIDAAAPTPLPDDPDAAPSLDYDAGSPMPSVAPEAGPDAACTQPLAQGVLAIDELMIASESGTGDYGEWLEVENTSPCAVNLYGLQGETAAGSKVYTFEQTEDLWIAPGGTFLVADVSDPAVNHYLPGPLVTWAGQPGDVLRNEGATITLSFQGALVDTVTYPSLKLKIGNSLAFPADCPLSSRSDWTSWQWSTFSWFPGFYGTPNAPNDDVTCP